MGRYTSNDNKSMQCNPNNERYWSSRGYDDDDYDDDYSSNYNHEEESKKIDSKRKEVINELSFNFSGKKIIFKESGRIVPFNREIFDPVGENFEYLSENILKEELVLKKDFNIKRSNLRSFLLNNVPSKNFEMRCNWFMRNMVEENGGCYGRYEYLLLEMFESENYVIFSFKDYLQGSKSIPSYERPQRWMFRDFKSGEYSNEANNIVEDLSEVFNTGD